MKFSNYINAYTEARREKKERIKKGLDPIKRTTAYDELEPYKNDPDIYISFRSIDKIGINPQSRYDTPNGIYTYPLKEMWSKFDHSNRRIKVPFAGENPYIYVVRSKGRGIDDLYLYDSKDFSLDMRKLKNFYDLEKVDAFVNEAPQKARVKNPGGSLWYVTWKLANGNAVKWNRLFFNQLDYGYVVDKQGQGVIHKAEPIQCVFFSTRAFTVVTKIIQDQHRKKIYNKTRTLGGGALEGGAWEGGTWEGGTWKNGTWEWGVWKKGTWESGVWKSGVWKNGTWENGLWKNGLWKSGTWKKGTWEGGTWESGIWKGGFIHDPKKVGAFEPEWKWKGNYVFSPISPKEYFK